MSKIPYKSFCWSMGTTSFRTADFNVMIERQLQLMRSFRSLPQNEGRDWCTLQEEYYYFLKENDFTVGNAQNPAKDAREKTSGLRDIGLLDDNRMLTEAGEALLAVVDSGHFDTDNFLEIPKDSFIYFKQLLKTSCAVYDNIVRPFVVLLYVLSKVQYLTDAEFAYLLPLCIDEITTNEIIELIKTAHKSGFYDYDAAISSVLMKMDNYKQALEQFLSYKAITQDLLCDIGMNRKSPKYDEVYYPLYTALQAVAMNKDTGSVIDVLNAIKKINNVRISTHWREYMFKDSSATVIKKRGMSSLNNVPIITAGSERIFREQFFRLMHLFKAKATLSDYRDLNRRYFNTSDILLFEDGMVKLDVLPKVYIEHISEQLPLVAFDSTDTLQFDVELPDISPIFDIDINVLYSRLGVSDAGKARQFIHDERYARFNRLVDERFGKEQLISLLEMFETRQDEEIRKLVTDNADVPTIFEYILGISWYLLSNREGDVPEYMNLSLDADLLPKTHAGGGEADIVWQYEKTDSYPEHALLIEATLSDGNLQRRMEMEPVSRHLGDYLLAHQDKEAYCVFITTYLHPNVISDFRGRRNMLYYDSTGAQYISGMKILPLQTSELKVMLKFDFEYRQIYKQFDDAYKTDDQPKEWYEKRIVGELNHLDMKRNRLLS